MSEKRRQQISSSERAEKLISELDVLRRARDRQRATRQQLRVWEQKYGVSSEELPEKVASGEIQETAEVCDWLLSIRLLEHIESESR